MQLTNFTMAEGQCPPGYKICGDVDKEFNFYKTCIDDKPDSRCPINDVKFVSKSALANGSEIVKGLKHADNYDW